MVYALAYSTSDMGSIPSRVILSEEESFSGNLLFSISQAIYRRWGHVNHLCTHGFREQRKWRTCGSPVLGNQSQPHTLKHTLQHINTKRNP